jgi:hypothetical protein
MASRRIRRRRPRRTRRGGVLPHFGNFHIPRTIHRVKHPAQGKASCPEGSMDCPYCGAPCKFNGDDLDTPYWSGKCDVCGARQGV